jgi:hypothetical protein
MSNIPSCSLCMLWQIKLHALLNIPIPSILLNGYIVQKYPPTRGWGMDKADINFNFFQHAYSEPKYWYSYLKYSYSNFFQSQPMQLLNIQYFASTPIIPYGCIYMWLMMRIFKNAHLNTCSLDDKEICMLYNSAPRVPNSLFNLCGIPLKPAATWLYLSTLVYTLKYEYKQSKTKLINCWYQLNTDTCQVRL